MCAQTLLGPVSDFKGLGKVYLSSSFPYVLAPSCGGHHMCSSAALGIFPSAGEGGIFPVDASWPLLLSHFFPFPVLHQAIAALSCLPLLPRSADGAELNPKSLQRPSQTKRERAGNPRGGEQSFRLNSKVSEEGGKKKPLSFSGKPRWIAGRAEIIRHGNPAGHGNVYQHPAPAAVFIVSPLQNLPTNKCLCRTGVLFRARMGFLFGT